MRKLLVLAAAAVSFTFSGMVNAAEVSSKPGGPPPSVAADAPMQIAATGKPIILEVGKGTLIRLDKPASTVFIANPVVADVQVKSPSLIYLDAKSPGETVLYAVDAEDRVLLNSPIRVELDVSRLRDSFHALMPLGSVKVSSVDNRLLLTGKVATAGDAERANSLARAIADETKGSVINDLGVATPNQVNLRVKIAEVDRNVLKQLGFNLSKLTGNIQFQTLGPSPSVTAPGTATTVVQTAIGGHNGPFLATLNALSTEGLMTVLAEPNLTATSGQPAMFHVGGSIPVPIAQPSTTGVATVTIDYKPFGVQLYFTPTIVDANHVSLHVRPEVSQLDFSNAVTVAGTTIPALSERTAETTVELGSGQSFALAGLLQNNTSLNVSKVPWLGEIPILGQLFRSEQFKRNETELIVIVTPYLVNPSATALAAPTDGYVAPHDAEQIINASTYRQTLPGPAKGPAGRDGQGLIGPVGFRVD